MAEAGLRLGEDDGRLALLIDGVVQSVRVPTGSFGSGYWPLMLPDVRPEAALLLGLGGGTILHLLFRRFGPFPVLAVENDPAVIELARESFGLPQGPVQVALADAFEVVTGLGGAYDYIGVDLFARGGVPAGTFRRGFLRRLRGLTNPGGLVAINFFRDRRTVAHQKRLEAVFPRVRLYQSEKNIVAHCRPR